MKYEAGQVVLVKYLSFTKEVVNGLFLILYCENADISTSNRKNYTVVKLTTQLVDTTYTVKISNKYNTFLDKNCYASCSVIQTFNDDQIIRELGKIDKNTLMKVYRSYRGFQFELERQFLDAMEQ